MSTQGNSINRVAGQSLKSKVLLDEDFIQGSSWSATDDIATFDLVGASATLTLSDVELNGVAIITSNSTTATNIQQNGEPYALGVNKKIIFETRVALTDADGMSFFAGLCIPNVAPFTTSLTDYVGFFTTDGNIKYGCGKDNNNVPGSGTSGETDADSGVDFADTTWAVLQFVVNGTNSVDFYVNGAHVGRVDTNLPDNEPLTAHVGMVGSGEVIWVDYVVVESDRDTAA